MGKYTFKLQTIEIDKNTIHSINYITVLKIKKQLIIFSHTFT